jgi:hypothetical protein
MNHQIEHRITLSLNALRSALTDIDIQSGHAIARTWLSKPVSPVSPHLQLAAALLRGQAVTRAFSPITNTRQLASGAAAHRGLTQAARWLAREARNDESPLATLPSALRSYLEKAAIVVALAALQVDFETALASGETARARTLMTQAMRICPQGPRQSTLEHCRSVAQHHRVLRQRLKNPDFVKHSYPNWVQHIPKWFDTWRAQLTAATENNGGLAQVYLEWHDCGKPFCLEYDASGRAHYPDHAQVSARLWERLGGSTVVAQLMAQDMDLHTLPPSAMPEFAKREHAALLLIATLAAVNANAQLFGGFESDSFKIKAKQLEARGKRLCEALFGNTNIKAVA